MNNLFQAIWDYILSITTISEVVMSWVSNSTVKIILPCWISSRCGEKSTRMIGALPTN